MSVVIRNSFVDCRQQLSEFVKQILQIFHFLISQVSVVWDCFKVCSKLKQTQQTLAVNTIYILTSLTSHIYDDFEAINSWSYENENRF